MDAVKFLGEFNRMCKTYQGCAGCRAIGICNYMGMESDAQRQELVGIVERWSKEHPQKTRLDDFKEKYPNASPDAHGFPDFCCAKLGYVRNCGKTTCEECWNMPLEEE